jgi:hypothetical protein
VAPHIAAPVPTESATQTAGAVTVTAIAVTGSTAEAAAKVIAAKTNTSATVGKCAGGKPGTSENKHNCKNNHGVAQHFDLFEMLPASASIQGPR